METTEQHDLLTEFDDSLEALPASVDRAAVERMRVVAHVLDDSVRIPGTEVRIGLDPFLGTVPVAGDVVSAGLSMYIVLEAARLGVTYTTLVRMLANVTLDVLGGSVPVVGDVFDALWKANKRNVELVLEDLRAEADDDEAVESVEIPVE